MQIRLFVLSACFDKALKCQDLSECNEDLAWDIQWITFHSCHRHMAHNALIFYAYFPLKQHNVHEQALLCRGWTSTSLLSHQLSLPETLNRQTPVLLCELAFYSRASQTCSGASRSLSLSSLIWFFFPSLSLSLLPFFRHPFKAAPLPFTCYCHVSRSPLLSLQLHLTNFPSSIPFPPLQYPLLVFSACAPPLIFYILIFTNSLRPMLDSLLFHTLAHLSHPCITLFSLFLPLSVTRIILTSMPLLFSLSL